MVDGKFQVENGHKRTSYDLLKQSKYVATMYTQDYLSFVSLQWSSVSTAVLSAEMAPANVVCVRTCITSGCLLHACDSNNGWQFISPLAWDYFWSPQMVGVSFFSFSLSLFSPSLLGQRQKSCTTLKNPLDTLQGGNHREREDTQFGNSSLKTIRAEFGSVTVGDKSCAHLQDDCCSA